MSSALTTVHAAVPRAAVTTIAGRAPDAEVSAIEDQDRLDGFQFIVPVPDGQAQLVGDL